MRENQKTIPSVNTALEILKVHYLYNEGSYMRWNCWANLIDFQETIMTGENLRKCWKETKHRVQILINPCIYMSTNFHKI